jgi:hypothetical protein
MLEQFSLTTNIPSFVAHFSWLLHTFLAPKHPNFIEIHHFSRSHTDMSASATYAVPISAHFASSELWITYHQESRARKQVTAQLIDVSDAVHLFDLGDILEPLTFRSISLHDEHGQEEDIRNYIKSIVNEDTKTQRWSPEHKQLVIERLTERANGM